MEGMLKEMFLQVQNFLVENGVILSKLSAEAEAQHGLMVARRQVAGTFGYFTRVPVQVNGSSVAKLRLVATKRNQTIIFGGFRSVDDAFDFIRIM